MTLARDRRRMPRHQSCAAEAIARLRLRAGREVSLLDISASGALVEGDARLLPGTHVDVHVVTANGRVLVRSRVVRAYVSAVARDCITYRSALAFERHVDIPGYLVPVVAAHPASELGTAYPTGSM
jgi:hypothetical protein